MPSQVYKKAHHRVILAPLLLAWKQRRTSCCIAAKSLGDRYSVLLFSRNVGVLA